MNKEEIRHFKSLLKQGSLRHMNILLNDKFQSELLDIIKDYERLIKENQKQKEVIDKAREFINENKDKYYQDWGQDDCSVDIYLGEYEIKELLDILNGEDKEVSE